MAAPVGSDVKSWADAFVALYRAAGNYASVAPLGNGLGIQVKAADGSILTLYHTKASDTVSNVLFQGKQKPMNEAQLPVERESSRHRSETGTCCNGGGGHAKGRTGKLALNDVDAWQRSPAAAVSGAGSVLVRRVEDAIMSSDEDAKEDASEAVNPSVVAAARKFADNLVQSGLSSAPNVTCSVGQFLFVWPHSMVVVRADGSAKFVHASKERTSDARDDAFARHVTQFIQ